MSVLAIGACIFRLFGLWSGLSFGAFILTLMMYSRLFTLGDSVPFLAQGAAHAIVSGVAWIFAKELGHWVEGRGRSAVESGMKLGASIYLMLYFARVVEVSASWLVGTGDGDRSMVVFGFMRETHALSGIIAFGLAVLLAVFAAPVGRAIAFRERRNAVERESDVDDTTASV